MDILWPQIPKLSLELVWEVSLTFAWPSELSWNGQFTIVATIGVAATQYLLQLFRWLDLRDKHKPTEEKPDELSLKVMRTFYRTHDPERTPEVIRKEWLDHRFEPEVLVAQMKKTYGESPLRDDRETENSNLCMHVMRAGTSSGTRAMRKMAHSFLNAMGQWALVPFEYVATGRSRGMLSIVAKDKSSGRARQEGNDDHRKGEKGKVHENDAAASTHLWQACVLRALC